MPVYLSLFSLDTDRPGNVGWATSKSGLMDEAWRGKEPLPGLGEEGGRRQQGRDAGMQWGVLRAWLWGAFLLPGLHQLHGKGSSWCSSRAPGVRSLSFLEIPCRARSELEESSEPGAASLLPGSWSFPTSLLLPRTFYPLKFLSFQHIL